MPFDIVVIYLCALTFQSVFTPIMLFSKLRRGSIKQPVSKGQLRYVVLRVVITFAIAAVGWALYLSRVSYLAIIPITALLDCAVLVFSAAFGEQIAQRFDGKHAAQ